MELDLIVQKIEEALGEVLEKDKHLFIHDISEPSMSHRLALYLESKFNHFNVDCEYNGNVDADSGRKYIAILKHRAKELGVVRKSEEAKDDDEFLYRKVFPDIIVHKRGNNKHNLLIIEVKKTSNSDNGLWDAEKISAFTSSDDGNKFNYQYGVFIRFTVGHKPDYDWEWYQEGKKITVS